MRSLEYDRFGSSSVTQIRERPRPTPGAREVLVKVRAAALNPKDVLVRKGKFALMSGRNFPRQMGYDFSGEIESAGSGVRNVRAGMVMTNLPTAGVDYHVPFGGTRKSSYGPREQGFAAVEFYTQVKTSYTWA